MGQQQLLLIVLAVIVIGAAVLWGIGLFRGSAIETKRDLLISESADIAIAAMGYYKKPVQFNGGGNSFTGWNIPSQMASTDAGHYIANVTADEVVITGTGTEVVTGTDTIKIQTMVSDTGYYSIVIH